MTIEIPTHVYTACKLLNQGGFSTYLVGGAVRDSLLSQTPFDWDIATDALPYQIEAIFSKTIPTGKEFGTITVLIDNKSLEVTTLRSDGPYGDSRHPDHVLYTDQIKTDLSRRDFTINAIAYEPFTRKIIDPYFGIRHLRRKLLKTVGDPYQRFQEDPLRMLRLLRFQSVLGFKIARKTRRAIKPEFIRGVSIERVQNELNKMLLGQELGQSLTLFYETGLMAEILPELSSCKGISPGKNHPFDLLGHSIMAAHFAKPELHIRWAALLHDLGKSTMPGREHQIEGAKMARGILTRLRCTKKLIKNVENLIANHMFTIHPHSSHRAWRRFTAQMGVKTVRDLIALRQADLAGLNKDPRFIINYGEEMTKRLEQIVAEKNALSIGELEIDGKILMDFLQIDAGPLVGEILAHLFGKVLADPTLNQRDQLLEQAQAYLKSKPKTHGQS